MNHMNNAEKFSELVTQTGVFSHVLASGSGFVSFPDGRQSFVSPALIRRLSLRIGDMVECRLAANFEDKATDHVPWRTIFASVVHRAAPSPDDAVIERLKPLVLSFLQQEGGAWSSAEIFAELALPWSSEPLTFRALDALRERGELCSAVLYQAAPDGFRGRETYWSLSYEALRPVGTMEDVDGGARRQ
jgi:hypothetical protein